ncbi:hypothetical protein [Clostridium sp.]|jgi:hypothetical protein|nr:hypothetical protein [Clostridium sp.]MDR3598183.1 hypothetical protein [Clostridium sp.]
MGTILDVLKIIDKLRIKKIKDNNDQENRKFKEILSEEMKKLN